MHQTSKWDEHAMIKYKTLTRWLFRAPSLWGLIWGSSPARIPIFMHSLSTTLKTSWAKFVQEWMGPLIGPFHLRTMMWRGIMTPSMCATPSKAPWAEVMWMSRAWIVHVKSLWFIPVAFTFIRMWSPRSLVLPGVVVRPRTCTKEKPKELHFVLIASLSNTTLTAFSTNSTRQLNVSTSMKQMYYCTNSFCLKNTVKPLMRKGQSVR